MRTDFVRNTLEHARYARQPDQSEAWCIMAIEDPGKERLAK